MVPALHRIVTIGVCLIVGGGLVAVTVSSQIGGAISATFEATVTEGTYDNSVKVAPQDELEPPYILVDLSPQSPHYGTIYVLGRNASSVSSGCARFGVAKSTDHGVSFQFRGAGPCVPWGSDWSVRKFVEAAIGMDGTLYATFGWYDFILSKDGGLTWAYGRNSTEGNQTGFPFFVVDVFVDPMTGRLHILGTSSLWFLPPLDSLPTLYHASSDDGGRTWSPTTVLYAPVSRDGSNLSYPGWPSGTAFGGTLVVTFTLFQENRSAQWFNDPVAVVVLRGNETRWTNMTPVTAGADFMMGPRVEASPHGLFALTWVEVADTDSPEGSIRQYRLVGSWSSDGGLTFSPALHIDSQVLPRPPFAGAPLAFDNESRLYVVWGTTGNGTSGGRASIRLFTADLVRDTSDNTSFVTFFDNPTDDEWIRQGLATDTDGSVYLAWIVRNLADPQLSGTYIRRIAGAASGDIRDLGLSLLGSTVFLEVRGPQERTGLRVAWHGGPVVLEDLPANKYDLWLIADSAALRLGSLSVKAWGWTDFRVRIEGPPSRILTMGSGLAGGLLLFGGSLLALQYARLAREDIFQRKLRHLIFEYVRNNPGSRFVQIRNALGLRNGVTAYHLSVLEKLGLLHSKARLHRRWYYPNDDISIWKDFPLSSLQHSILEKVRKSPGLGIREIARNLDRRVSVVSDNVKALAREGFLRTVQEGQRVCCFPTDANSEP